MIVAVTGSAGKTTTKEAIRTVLAAAGETHDSIKSFNNHWGVPLMLARMPREAQFGVFEIGMNHAGEITPLAKLVRPHIAVITTVAAAHLEFFNSVDRDRARQGRNFPRARAGRHAVLNADHDYLHVLFAAARAAGVATSSPMASTRMPTGISPGRNGGARTFARVTHGGRDASISTCRCPAVTWSPTRWRRWRSLSSAVSSGRQSPSARWPVRRAGGQGHDAAARAEPKPLLLVDESYNANVASMNAAMDVFAR